MNIEQLKIVVKFLIGQKKTPHVVTAMRTFNETRYHIANNARKTLEDKRKIITCLREATGVTQIQAVPENVKCSVSGETLNDRTGITLIIKKTSSEQTVFCVHSRFVDACYQMFITSHFDLHIRQHFQKWCTQQSWWVPGDASDKTIQRYIQFNNERNLKLLLIQLNQHT